MAVPPNFVFSGYLVKQGALVKNWKERLFELDINNEEVIYSEVPHLVQEEEKKKKRNSDPTSTSNKSNNNNNTPSNEKASLSPKMTTMNSPSEKANFSTLTTSSITKKKIRGKISLKKESKVEEISEANGKKGLFNFTVGPVGHTNRVFYLASHTKEEVKSLILQIQKKYFKEEFFFL